MKMTDFNPNSRVRGEFFYPLPNTSWFARAENYLISILSQPNWIRGIDISHWNGTVDFQKVKDSGIDFVIIKCTEGIGFVDDHWETNWRGTLDHEMIPMPYHFFRSNYKGAAQVDWFMQNADTFLNHIEGKTCLWWDVETSDGVDITTRQNRLLGACVNTIKNGLQTGYYSSPYKWQTLIGNPTWANDYFGWVAHWSSVAYPTLPIGWTKEKTKVWQNGVYPTYSWVEQVDGAGTVDHNYFFGTLQELRDWLGYVPPQDCCEEIKLKIDQIENDLINVKSRLAQGELTDIEHDNALDYLKDSGEYDSKRINEIENLIQSLKDVICK